MPARVSPESSPTAASAAREAVDHLAAAASADILRIRSEIKTAAAELEARAAAADADGAAAAKERLARLKQELVEAVGEAQTAAEAQASSFGADHSPPAAPWHEGHTLAVVVLTFGIVIIGRVPESLGGMIEWMGIWRVTGLLMLAIVLVAGWGQTGRVFGALIDGRNKMTLSRLQMIIWTIVVMSSFITAVQFNLSLLPGQVAGAATDVAIDPTLWALMGISTASLVGSPMLLANRKYSLQLKQQEQGRGLAVDPIHSNPTIADAGFADMFRGEENANAARLDLAKIQMFFFTIILALAYVSQLSTMFESVTQQITALPAFDQGAVALLAISHSGYLASKAVDKK